MSSNNISTKEHIFLATTALEEFWDTTKPIVFLGEWCRRYHRREFWQPLGGEVLPNPWGPSYKRDEVYTYVNELYERSLPIIAEALNNIHNTKHSIKYWRIVIGMWYFLYIAVLYDRYLSLKYAIDNYPSFSTIGLSEDNHVTPHDTLSFFNLTTDDPYNLQFYTKILDFLNIDFPRKRIGSPIVNYVTYKRITWKSPIKYSLKNFLYFIAKKMQGRNQITLYNSYFPLKIQALLFIKSRGKIFPLPNIENKLIPILPDRHSRDGLKDIRIGDSEFELLLSELIPSDIPICFVESYGAISKTVKEKFAFHPKKILSANSWFFDEIFKQWVGECSASGAKLLAAQHGGNYGSTYYNYFLPHESMIADRFYSWGWCSSGYKSAIVPLSATKLAGRRQIGASNSEDGILFVSTTASRYMGFHFPESNQEFNDYLSWQMRFACALRSELKMKMRVRLLRDRGWDFAQRWNDNYPEIAIETFEDSPFLKSLERCRIYVCDNLSTTYIESLLANKPTILFYNSESSLNKLKLEVLPYYNELISSGILFLNPEDAATKVNSIYNDIEGWWNDPNIQSVRYQFCERFAKVAGNPADEWFKELIKEV